MTNPLIPRLRLLTSLSDDDLQALDRACALTMLVRANTAFVPEGNRPQDLHIVPEGWAARYRFLSRERRAIPMLLLPGDICDLDGFMLERVHSGICTLTKCLVAVLPHADLEVLLEERPAIRNALLRLVSIDDAISASWILSLGRHSADERMAHLLCELLFRLRTVGLAKDNSFALPIAQRDLADTLGMSTVHVNRVLKDLRARGLITLEQRRLTVRDLEALKRLAGFDASYLFVQDSCSKHDAKHVPATSVNH